jgi:hypothetical protein
MAAAAPAAHAQHRHHHGGFPSNHPKVEEVYDLGQQLGKGSFSTVYLGVHKTTGEKVRAGSTSASTTPQIEGVACWLDCWTVQSPSNADL